MGKPVASGLIFDRTIRWTACAYAVVALAVATVYLL